MISKVYSFLLLMLHDFHVRRTHREQFLLAQIAILKKRLQGRKLIPSPDERNALLAHADRFGHAVDDLLLVVGLDTPTVAGGVNRRKAELFPVSAASERPTKPLLSSSG